jgi:hypothetical protein
MSFATAQKRIICWGIDPGSSYFSIAAMGTDLRVMHEEKYSVPKTEGGNKRLDEVIFRDLYNGAKEVFESMQRMYPPDLICIELPISSTHQKFNLMLGMGAVSAAASEVVGEAVSWMPPTEWRRRAGTNAWKEAGAALVASLPFSVYSARHDIRIRKRSTKPSSVAQAQAFGPENFDIDICEARCIGVAGIDELMVDGLILPVPGAVVR